MPHEAKSRAVFSLKHLPRAVFSVEMHGGTGMQINGQIWYSIVCRACKSYHRRNV